MLKDMHTSHLTHQPIAIHIIKSFHVTTQVHYRSSAYGLHIACKLEWSLRSTAVTYLTAMRQPGV